MKQAGSWAVPLPDVPQGYEQGGLGKGGGRVGKRLIGRWPRERRRWPGEGEMEVTEEGAQWDA